MASTVEVESAREMAEEESIRAAYWQVRPDETVMDIGAGYGSYTLGPLAAGATVVAVESARLILAELIGQSHVLPGVLHPVHTAVYDRSGYPKRLVEEIGRLSSMAPLDCEWTTVDALVERLALAHLDRIKVDVEGGELGVLRSASVTLARWHPMLLVEDHTKVYPWVKRTGSTGRIRRLLDGLDYSVQTVPYDGAGVDRDYLICT